MNTKTKSALSLAALLSAGTLQAAIQITSAPVPDLFPAIPPTDQWVTLDIGTGTDAAVTEPLAFDAKVIAATDASDLLFKALLSSGSFVPTNSNTGFRQNTGAGAGAGGVTFLQSKPTERDYLLLLGHLENATGGPLNSVQISYDYSKATDTATEQVKGFRVYWSLDGTPGSWKLIDGLSVDTTGTVPAPQHLSTSIILPSALPAGGTMKLLFADQNSNGTDASYHFTNFTAGPGLSVAVSATATSGTRSPGASVTDPADDTVSFDLTVNGTGSLSPAGWTVTAPASLAGTTGAYGTAKTISNVPISAFTNGVLSVVIADAATAAATTSVGIKTQHVIGTNTITNTPILSSAPPPASWVIDDATRTSTQNSAGQGDLVITSTAIDLSTTGLVEFSADLEAIAGTSSGFETADSFALELIIDGGAPVSVLGAADLDGSGRLTGLDAATNLELPGATDISITRPFHFSFPVPAAANNVEIRITGNSNSASETYVVKNVTLGPPAAGVYASLAGPVTVNDKGTVDPSDDEFSAPVNITSVNVGASTGWHTDEVPQRTGLYATANPVTFGPYPVTGGTKTVVITDNVNAAFTATVALTPPASTVYVIGQVNLGGGTVNLFSDPATVPPAQWINNAAARTLTMSTGLATDSVVTSQTLDLSAVGTVQFSATFRANETSNGSNFEVTDKFKAELIIDGVSTNLISTWDTGNGDGATVGTGLNGTPDGYLNGYNGAAGVDVVTQIAYAAAADDYNTNAARDEFNLTSQQVGDSIDNSFPLTFTIPAAANSVQLVITGAGAAGTEFFTVSNVLFSTGGGGPADTDGDGVSDTDEGIMGTSSTDPNDVLRLTQNPANPTQIQFPSKTGKFYRVYSSSTLAAGSWTSSGTTIPGDDSVKAFQIITTGGPRLYYQLRVMATDGPWAP